VARTEAREGTPAQRRDLQPLNGPLARGYSLAKEKWALVTGFTFRREAERARARRGTPL